jgi:hypothetical protein
MVKTFLLGRARIRCATLSAVISISALFVPTHALATAELDQQQPVIDISVGGIAVGSFSQQKVAQVVTAGISGHLTEIRLPLVCGPISSLILQIQGVTNEKPNGTVLGTTIVPGSSLPSFFPGEVTLRPLQLSQPIAVTQGHQFAIVLDATGEGCGMFQGPVGDSYVGGNAYFDSRPNPVGMWVCMCEFASARWDVPFQTLVERQDTSPPVITPAVSGTQGTNGWYTSAVTVTWDINDPDSGINSSSGCDAARLTADTQGTTVTCSATNGAGLSNSSSVTIKIDQTPPTCSVGVTPKALWPPNHQLVSINDVVGVTDSTSGPDGFTLTSVRSSEPDNGLGDGDQANDIQGFVPGTASISGKLRAERSGTGLGRTYTLTYRAMDQAGNTASCTGLVRVPRDLGH